MQNNENKKKAKWKRGRLSGYIYCSACLYTPETGEQKKICPNCKAEMEGADEK